MRSSCWKLLTRCGVHTMSFALGIGVKFGDAINHLTLVVVSFGRCVVIGVRCHLSLVVYRFSFCSGFSICVPKKKQKKGHLFL
jgi:hypothetical protein